MKKLVLCLAILSIFAYILSAQINVVKAATPNGGGPVTSPVTSPITYFKIQGKVMYKFLNWFKVGSGVKITLTDLNNHKISTTTTDKSGQYSFSETNGNYKLTAADNNSTSFLPNGASVTINSSDVTVNFLGLATK